MPDVHVPKVHSASVWKVLLEVLLISIGVFLGLLGEHWREGLEHRELASQSLRRLAAELRTNEATVKEVMAYHEAERPMLEKYLAADVEARRAMSLKFESLRPARFRHSEWDLAVATQALAYIEPSLAADLSHAYQTQEDYAGLTSGVVQSAYQPQNALALLNADRHHDWDDAFLSLALLYYKDLASYEPRLVKIYDDLLARIGRTLGDSPPEPAARR
jgi:hypothetical protein